MKPRPRQSATLSSTGSHEPAARSDTTTPAEDERPDPRGGPATLDWWLDDGPESPIAADIEEPEKHL